MSFRAYQKEKETRKPTFFDSAKSALKSVFGRKSPKGSKEDAKTVVAVEEAATEGDALHEASERMLEGAAPVDEGVKKAVVEETATEGDALHEASERVLEGAAPVDEGVKKAVVEETATEGDALHEVCERMLEGAAPVDEGVKKAVVEETATEGDGSPEAGEEVQEDSPSVQGEECAEKAAGDRGRAQDADKERAGQGKGQQGCQKRAKKIVPRCPRNNNEPGDFTKEMRRKMMEDSNLFFSMMKTLNTATAGDFVQLLDEHVKDFDPRDQAKIKYQITEALMCDILGGCMGLDKARSIDMFLNQDYVIKNLEFVCGFEGLPGIPDRATRENIYKTLDIDRLREVNYIMVHELIKSKRYEDSRFDTGEGKYYSLIIDGVQTAYFTKKHCDCCLRQKVREDADGNPVYGYSHKWVEARLLLSDSLVIHVDSEPIENGPENASKQDCEVNAAYRLLERIHKNFPHTKFMLQGDSLYASAPLLDKAVNDFKMAFMVTVKEGSQPTIFEEAQKAIGAGNCGKRKVLGKEGEEAEVAYVNGIGKMAGKDLSFDLNFLQLTVEKVVTHDGKVKVPVRETLHADGWKHSFDKELSNDCMDDILGSGKKAGKGEKGDGLSKAEREAVKKVVEQETGTVEGPGTKTQKKVCDVYVKEVAEDDGTVSVHVKLVFSWLASFAITDANASKASKRGRNRWKIETSFNNQKNGLFNIQHQKGLDSNVMKVMYMLTQFSDTILQLFFAYDKTAGRMPVGQKAFQYFILISCYTQLMEEWPEDYEKRTGNLYENKRVG